MVNYENVRKAWGHSPVNRVFIVGFTPPVNGWKKQLVDSRPRPNWMVELASCVRTTFLISNNLRRNTRLYFVGRSPNSDEFSVLLEGSELRYVEPSERNTLLLLGRAFDFIGKSKYPRRSTPGITWLPIGIKEILQLESLTQCWMASPITDSDSILPISSASQGVTKTDRLGILLNLDESVRNSFEEAFDLLSDTVKRSRVGDPPIHGSMIILISHFELDRRCIP